MLNINLPDRWFFTLYPSTEIRINYGDPIPGQLRAISENRTTAKRHDGSLIFERAFTGGLEPCRPKPGACSWNERA
jgi:hypothetical protein